MITVQETLKQASTEHCRRNYPLNFIEGEFAISLQNKAEEKILINKVLAFLSGFDKRGNPNQLPINSEGRLVLQRNPILKKLLKQRKVKIIRYRKTGKNFQSALVKA